MTTEQGLLTLVAVGAGGTLECCGGYKVKGTLNRPAGQNIIGRGWTTVICCRVRRQLMRNVVA